MGQIQLMLVANSLNPGEAIVISRKQVIQAAEGNLSSLLFDRVREEDIKQFADQAGKSWGVEFEENILTGNYMMSKCI